MPEEDPRVRLAAERTLLAWMRTGLAMMGFGFVVARFGMFLREMDLNNPHPHHTGFSLAIGVTLILLGVAANLAAAWQHSRLLRIIDTRPEAERAPWPLSVVMAAALAAIGLLMGAYLIVLKP